MKPSNISFNIHDWKYSTVLEAIFQWRSITGENLVSVGVVWFPAKNVKRLTAILLLPTAGLKDDTAKHPRENHWSACYHCGCVGDADTCL